MINLILVNENQNELNAIERIINYTESFVIRKKTSTASDALKYIHKFPVDICIIDVDDPSVQDVNLYSNISSSAKVIFTSFKSDFAVEAFRLNAIDYLLKPFLEERFNESLQKAKRFFSTQLSEDGKEKNDHFFIRADYRLMKIKFNEILYIEGLDDYLKIHLSNMQVVVARCTLKAINEKLQSRNFIRVHRSFIVPVERIQSVRNRCISINDNIIPIGNSYLNSFYNTVSLHAIAS